MGFSLSWIAVQPSIEPALRAHFGLRDMEETAEAANFPLSLARVGDWIILQWDHQDHLIDEGLLRSVSANGRVVAVMVEEHVMYASVEEWEKGERTWGVVHCGDIHVLHLDEEGSFPSSFSAIKERYITKQVAAGGEKARVDHLFDIPLDLAEAVVGYRHDKDDGSQGTFHEVEADKEPEEHSARQRLIGGIAATHNMSRSNSVWYKNHKAQQPGFFARLFGKN